MTAIQVMVVWDRFQGLVSPVEYHVSQAMGGRYFRLIGGSVATALAVPLVDGDYSTGLHQHIRLWSLDAGNLSRLPFNQPDAAALFLACRRLCRGIPLHLHRLERPELWSAQLWAAAPRGGAICRLASDLRVVWPYILALALLHLALLVFSVRLIRAYRARSASAVHKLFKPSVHHKLFKPSVQSTLHREGTTSRPVGTLINKAGNPVPKDVMTLVVMVEVSLMLISFLLMCTIFLLSEIELDLELGQRLRFILFNFLDVVGLCNMLASFVSPLLLSKGFRVQVRFFLTGGHF